MRMAKVLEVLNKRIEWLAQRLDRIDDKECGAWHWTHQEYVALQEAERLVAAEVVARKPLKASERDE